VLVDVRCAVCGGVGAALCDPCVRALRPAPDLGAPPPGVDRFAALVRYDGAGRELVLALKYRNRRQALGRLALALAALVDDPAPAAVTWAPTTAARRAERGYDQAELLARAVARRLGRPARRLLRRAPGRAQTGLDRAERLAGPTFAARRCAGSVLLVDDVRTTGATLAGAAVALRAAGAGSVEAIALAVTPFAPTEVHSRRPRRAPITAREVEWCGAGGNRSRSGGVEPLNDQERTPMQPTDVQVERTLAALQDAPQGGRGGRGATTIDRDALDSVLHELPEGLLDGLGTGPSLRPDRLEEARDRLETGVAPTDDELASRIVGRLVCDRLT
jgi:predicted amidophosphoribosyltransferase